MHDGRPAILATSDRGSNKGAILDYTFVHVWEEGKYKGHSHITFATFPNLWPATHPQVCKSYIWSTTHLPQLFLWKNAVNTNVFNSYGHINLFLLFDRKDQQKLKFWKYETYFLQMFALPTYLNTKFAKVKVFWPSAHLNYKRNLLTTPYLTYSRIEFYN